MVTKLKDNKEYIEYIRKKMSYFFAEWEEDGTTVYEESNNNFGISFKNNLYKIRFVKERGLLELNIYYKNDIIPFGYLLYNSILDKIPSQDSKWRTSLCVELIDFYICFLQKYFIKSKAENVR